MASYLAQGFSSEAPDLSELHQAWSLFRDLRSDYSRTLYNSGPNVLMQRGLTPDTISLLSRMALPLRQNPNSPAMSDQEMANYVSSESLKNTFPDEYPHPIRLKAAYEPGAINEDNNKQKREYVQHLVMEHGAVRIGYRHLDEGMNYDGINYYLPDIKKERLLDEYAKDKGGWDNHYPRSIFPNNPNIDGAYLAQNSYGSSFGEGRYF